MLQKYHHPNIPGSKLKKWLAIPHFLPGSIIPYDFCGQKPWTHLPRCRVLGRCTALGEVRLIVVERTPSPEGTPTKIHRKDSSRRPYRWCWTTKMGEKWSYIMIYLCFPMKSPFVSPFLGLYLWKMVDCSWTNYDGFATGKSSINGDT